MVDLHWTDSRIIVNRCPIFFVGRVFVDTFEFRKLGMDSLDLELMIVWVFRW